MKIQRIFAVFLAFGLIFSSFILFQRVKSENQYKHYEITLDYNDMERFSSETSKDIKSVLSDFKEAGAASVNVGEATINSLKLNTDYKISTSFEGYDLVEAPAHIKGHAALYGLHAPGDAAAAAVDVQRNIVFGDVFYYLLHLLGGVGDFTEDELDLIHAQLALRLCE